MRTTVNIDGRLLAEAKMIAAREHRTIGSVLEEALQRLFDAEAAGAATRADFVLHSFEPMDPSPLPGVDLEDKESLSEALGDDAAHASA